MVHQTHSFEARALATVADLENTLQPKIASRGSVEANLSQVEIEHILAVVMLRLARQRDIHIKGVPIRAEIGVPYTAVQLESGLMTVAAQIAVIKPISDVFITFEYQLLQSNQDRGQLELVGKELQSYQEKTPFHKRAALGLLGISLRKVITDWLSEPNRAVEDALSPTFAKNGTRLTTSFALQSWGVVAKLLYESI